MNVYIFHFSGQLGIKVSGGQHKVERNRLYVLLPKNEDIYLMRSRHRCFIISRRGALCILKRMRIHHMIF